MPFNYLEYKDNRSQEAYKLTYEFLSKHPAELEKIENLSSAWQIMFDLIPCFVDHIGSGHTFPISEASLDAEYSRQICFMGFYKQAFLALRGALELGLLSIAWNFDDNANINIHKWIRSQEDTPRAKEIIKKVFLVENIKKFSEEVNIEDEIKILYKVLSNFAHTKGTGYSSYAHNKANFAQFQEKSLLRWIALFDRVTKIVCTVHLLKYPVGLQYTPMSEKFGLNGPVGIFLEPGQSERVKRIFDQKTLSLMQKISDEDPNAIAQAEWVNQFPDITEEEFEKQIFEFDQSSIKMEGWKAWNERESKELVRLKLDNSEFYNKHLEKYETLKAWAKENNLLNQISGEEKV